MSVCIARPLVDQGLSVVFLRANAVYVCVPSEGYNGQFVSFWYPFDRQPENHQEQIVHDYLLPLLTDSQRSTVVGVEYWGHRRAAAPQKQKQAASSGYGYPGHRLHYDIDSPIHRTAGKRPQYFPWLVAAVRELCSSESLQHWD
jgi:hypothetical protein